MVQSFFLLKYGTDGELSLYCGDNLICELISCLKGGYVWMAQLGPAHHPSIDGGPIDGRGVEGVRKPFKNSF